MTAQARPRRVRSVVGGMTVGLLVVGFARFFHNLTVSHKAETTAQASFIWGVLLLASFAGWGDALNAMLFPERRADWGLRCAWGWAIAVAVGGYLCAVKLATRNVLLGFTALGLSFLCFGVAQTALRWARRSGLGRARLLGVASPFLAGACAIFALGFVQMFGVLPNQSFNPNDDNIAYFPFAREILERGTLTQPFSLRRISSFGGKSLLDALQLAIDVPETHLHLLDKGLATLTVLALIAGHLRSWRRSAGTVLLLAMLFVVTMQDIRINTSAIMTGVVFFLGLYRTLLWPPVKDGHDPRASVPVALLAAGACTLRQNYLVPIAATLVFAYGEPIVRSLRRRPLHVDREALWDAAMTAAMLLALLSPWSRLASRWCGTFLFPVLKGNYDKAYAFFPHLKLVEWLHYIWGNVGYLLPVKALPLFLLAVPTLLDRSPRRPLASIVLASLVGFAMLLYGYSNGFKEDQARYYAGFTIAAVLAIALAAADLAAQRPGRSRRIEHVTGVMLVIVGLALQLYEDRDRTFRTFDAYINQLTSPVGWPRSTPNATYQALQEPVPANATIVVMVDNPSWFDYRRNPIASLDMVGAVSPPPGIPLAAGGEAVAGYLLARGYRYLVVVSPDSATSLYRRDAWVKHQAETGVWHDSAHFYLEAFDDFDHLVRTRLHLAEGGNMTTLDLARHKP